MKKLSPLNGTGNLHYKCELSVTTEKYDVVIQLPTSGHSPKKDLRTRRLRKVRTL